MSSMMKRMSYEIDVRKSNDKHIKRAAKGAKKVVRGKGQDLSPVYIEFILFLPRVQRPSRLPVALIKDVKENKTILSLEKSLSATMECLGGE